MKKTLKKKTVRRVGIFFTVAILVVGMVTTSNALVLDFERATPGNLGEEWVEAGNNKFQKNLWQVGTDNGRDNSRGASLSPSAESSYQIIHPGSATGTDFELRVDMKLTITGSRTHIANDEIIGISLSDSQSFGSGSKQFMMFIRRDNGTKWGYMLNGASPIGWRENSQLGLPDILRDSDDAATSDWFTLVLSFIDNGDNTWILTGSILDVNKNELISSSQTVNKPSGDMTLYPCIQVDWTDNVLKDGAIADLVVDNIKLNEEV